MQWQVLYTQAFQVESCNKLAIKLSWPG